MNSLPPSAKSTKPPFTCACQEWQRSACAEAGFYKLHEGKQYCVIHYPNQEKLEDFTAELQNRVKNGNYDFSGAWFPSGTYFYKFHFKADANFSQARFTTFADFAEARFDSKVSFYGTAFIDDAVFHYATFCNDANFKFAHFHKEADFHHALFRTVANFSHAKFLGLALFAGSDEQVLFDDNSRLSLQYTQISKPEEILFQHVTLRPSWFIGTQVRNIVFADVTWINNITDEISNAPQIAELSHVKASPAELLSSTYRQLAINAEENHRYDEAANFRYASMDVQRRKQWHGMAFWRLHWWYWIMSGYGERVGRAATTLFIVLALFSIAYTLVKFYDPSYPSGTSLSISQAILYSLEVGALQNPEPEPITYLARYTVLAETIIVPFQVALLALAIRRRFIR